VNFLKCDVRYEHSPFCLSQHVSFKTRGGSAVTVCWLTVASSLTRAQRSISSTAFLFLETRYEETSCRAGTGVHFGKLIAFHEASLV
jgi:hypothetical protein